MRSEVWRQSLETSIEELETTRQAALRWLTESDIRTPDGGYRAVYRPESGAYEDWYDGETSLVCTAGAALALDRAGYEELALRSAEHICGLAIERNGPWRGALRAGRNSCYVVANYVSTAVLALLRAYEHSRNARFLEVAAAAGDFVIHRMQRRDGSIRRDLSWNTRLGRLDRDLMPSQTWSAHCIEGLLRLSQVTGQARYRTGAVRAADWLLRLQRRDGSFPLEAPARLTWLAAVLARRSHAETFPRDDAHPAIQTYAIKGLMMLDRLPEARRTVEWLSRRLGANGLFHQFYFPDGGRSVEEDVMPTAHFGLLLLEYPELAGSRDLLAAMAKGMCYARIREGDGNARGALRGLPLHPERGGHAYCWDTSFALLFLEGLVEGTSMSSRPA
jgi:hypothetical protein